MSGPIRASDLDPSAAVQGGALPAPLPLFPPTNWWNLDISAAPPDANSGAFITYLGVTRGLHPDFGGEEFPGSEAIYGFPYIVVDGTQPKLAVDFSPGWPGQCDGVSHPSNISFPFYPIPAEAITQPHWVEGGAPGNVNQTAIADRHILVVDRDNKILYELWNAWYNGTNWRAGSGAAFDLKQSSRRPETWTSADAAGLAILPGLVRHDEVFGAGEIGHAFRVTVRNSNGFVWPASHEAGSTSGALPMGARLRLKATKDISGETAEVQRIFRAMKKYGLIVADNGSDLYISGTFDTRWDNDVLNPAFGRIKGGDFEVIELGWPPQKLLRSKAVTSLNPVTPPLSSILPLSAANEYLATVKTEDTDPEAVLNDNAHPLIFYALDGILELHLSKAAGATVMITF